MSTISKPVYTSFFECDIAPRRSTRSSGTCAMPTVVSMVENGCAATIDDAPVSALKRLDLPLFGKPTSPRRSTRGAYRRPFATNARGKASFRRPLACVDLHEKDRDMSKKTSKRKLRSRRNKANHGKRPNSGRR